MRQSAAILAAASLLAGAASAQEEAAPAPERSATSAIVSWTQFLGGAVAGEAESDLQYGGRIDLYATIDGRDIGLWDGLSIKVHPEFVYGENVNTAGAGVLLPPNVALAFPSSAENDFDLSLYVVQRLGRASLSVGKINMLDLAAGAPLIGGGGQQGFQHTAFATPPSGIAPPTIFGGLLSMPMGAAALTLGVWDPASAVNRSGLEDAFETGVAGMASLSAPTRWGGNLGVHTFTVQATSIEGLDLNDIPDVFLPPESEAVLGQAQGGVMLRYALTQHLWQDPHDPNRGWGVFAQIAAWEDNPLPFHWGVIFGVAGSSPIPSRPRDRFGLGYYRISLSPPLRDGLTPVVELSDEQGLEAFYTFQLGQYSQLSFDAQYIDPVVRDFDDAVFLGAHLRVATH